MPGQTFELADVFAAAMDARLAGVFTAMPGEVQSYDPISQAVDVQPLVQTGYIGQDGTRATERTPLVPHVPVLFPGAGGFSITWPLKQGNTGLLIFCNCSIDKWLTLGGEVDPEDDRRHCIADAVFIPGLRPFASPLADAATDSMVLAGPDVRVGAHDGALPIVVQSALDDFMTALQAAITALGFNPLAGALAALQTELQALNAGAGWKANTQYGKAA